MVKLKEAREAAGYTQPQTAMALWAVEPRLRSADISRYENDVCRPTPEQLAYLCQLFGVDPTDIYAKEEMDLAGCLKQVFPRAAKAQEDKAYYKITANLPKGPCKGLKTKAAACGYGTITGWLESCVEKLNAEYKKIAPAAPTAETKPKEKYSSKEYQKKEAK